MTRIIADDNCESCGSVLVPPQVASGFKIPQKTDYVCLKCGRPYRWIGKGVRTAHTFMMSASKVARRCV
jgi:RNase P subunit RPR2